MKNELAAIVSALTETPRRVADLARQMQAQGFGAGVPEKQYARRVWRIVQRMGSTGILMSRDDDSGRVWHVADRDRLEGFTYAFVDAGGSARPDLRRAQAAESRRKALREASPASGCVRGDVVTSNGQPFVCVGVAVVETTRGRRMTVSQWESCCAYGTCEATFVQPFPVRFPFNVQVSPVRNCERHRGTGRTRVKSQVDGTILNQWEKFAWFRDDWFARDA